MNIKPPHSFFFGCPISHSVSVLGAFIQYVSWWEAQLSRGTHQAWNAKVKKQRSWSSGGTVLGTERRELVEFSGASVSEAHGWPQCPEPAAATGRIELHPESPSVALTQIYSFLLIFGSWLPILSTTLWANQQPFHKFFSFCHSTNGGTSITVNVTQESPCGSSSGLCCIR